MEMSDERDERRGGGAGGDVMLAYGLNKNLKQIQSRPKSAKPPKKRKGGKGGKKKTKNIFEEEDERHN